MTLSEENLRAAIGNFLDKEIKGDERLRDLVHDSFLLVELVMTLQEDFGVRLMQEDLKDVDTVEKLVNCFISKG